MRNLFVFVCVMIMFICTSCESRSGRMVCTKAPVQQPTVKKYTFVLVSDHEVELTCGKDTIKLFFENAVPLADETYVFVEQ